jgi:hypothetical protein
VLLASSPTRSFAHAPAPISQRDLLGHLKEVLEDHDGVTSAHFTVDTAGRIVDADDATRALVWPATGDRPALRTTSLGAALPSLLEALARRGADSVETLVHDATLLCGTDTVRVRFWLLPSDTAGATDVSLYMQFA